MSDFDSRFDGSPFDGSPFDGSFFDGSFFDSLVADSGRAGLAAPEALRRIGRRRTRLRRAAAIAAAAVVLSGAVTAGLALRRDSAHLPPVVPVPVPSVTGASPAPASPAPPSRTPAATVSTGSPSASGEPDCAAGQFGVASMTQSGAMGSLITEFTVTYHGRATCHIARTPKLMYRTPAGALATVPVPGTGSAPAPLSVHSGARLSFSTKVPNGSIGYDPSSAACAHPATYTQLSVDLGNGRLGLPNYVIDLRCGTIELSDWRVIG